MKISSVKLRQTAFTFWELIVVLAIVAVLIAMLLPAMSKTKVHVNRIRCDNNLKQIALSFKMFADDNEQKFPFFVTNSVAFQNTNDAWLHFLALSNELGIPKILICPQDIQRHATTAAIFPPDTNSNYPSLSILQNKAVSYFVNLDGDETKPDMVLTGDRNTYVTGLAASGSLLETSDTGLLRWNSEIHTNRGNVALCDGSVSLLNNSYPAWKDHTNKVRLLLPQ